ncbi:hypothetical protein CRV01_04220 [Arcobacter sp. CECT 8983]|uniref:hypothetical protein n=1 Tax=Arcobacter sp. CECT 8983 TaxID=2044508 RepID=UPI00100B50C9|nr:hypothetical protein [Arcobacter sp. CECT 8983]RXJ90370.1 hypothetical protein CRV01_04220 [Arcobacter sp. CECT 8983]
MKNLTGLNEIELIKLAKTATDENTLHTLADNAFITVRRCVAKNIHATTPIANKLAIDSACNVSYWATRHSNHTTKKKVESQDPCVICPVDELQYHSTCNSCDMA